MNVASEILASQSRARGEASGRIWRKLTSARVEAVRKYMFANSFKKLNAMQFHMFLNSEEPILSPFPIKRIMTNTLKFSYRKLAKVNPKAKTQESMKKFF
jgi:hypothetical protein